MQHNDLAPVAQRPGLVDCAQIVSFLSGKGFPASDPAPRWLASGETSVVVVIPPARYALVRERSLLKRAIKGTYVSVDPFHLSRYVDEQVFRFNHREAKDGQRFAKALRRVIGERLTYEALTGAAFDFATT